MVDADGAERQDRRSHQRSDARYHVCRPGTRIRSARLYPILRFRYTHGHLTCGKGDERDVSRPLMTPRSLNSRDKLSFKGMAAALLSGNSVRRSGAVIGEKLYWKFQDYFFKAPASQQTNRTDRRFKTGV